MGTRTSEGGAAAARPPARAGMGGGARNAVPGTHPRRAREPSGQVWSRGATDCGLREGPPPRLGIPPTEVERGLNATCGIGRHDKPLCAYLEAPKEGVPPEQF